MDEDSVHGFDGFRHGGREGPGQCRLNVRDVR